MSAGADGAVTAPRGVLLGLAALVLFALLAAAVARTMGPPAARVPEAEADVRLVLHFRDLPDGSLAVVDATDGAELAVLEPGTGGFVRGLMRAMARMRKQQGIGAEAPFELASQVDGRLVLEDPATGNRIALDAFGPSNVAAFSSLFATRG